MTEFTRIVFVCFGLTVAMQTSVGAGTISGRVSYPSDYTPPDMAVCAETFKKIIVKCVKSTRFYRMELPAGLYYIYAKTSEMKGYKAYYTESVVCGGGTGGIQGCNSHKRITVKVGDVSIRSNVNPQDWYD